MAYITHHANTYMGLDLATKSGVAVWNTGHHIAWVGEYKCDPVHLMTHILALDDTVNSDAVFVFEQIHSTQNAKTTRGLAERYGFIKYTLLSQSRRVEECHLSTVRAHFKLKTKADVKKFFQGFSAARLTDNHTDALAVAIYQSYVDGHTIDYSKLRIDRL